jgi:cystathionine beta-lyase/cystathionine gamma-synthase
MRANATAFGFMLTFELEGGRDAVNRFFQRLQRVPFCPSLGDVRTTVSHPATTSHRGLTDEEQTRVGIVDGLVRVSVGIESADDLIADFRQAMES